MSRVRTQPAQSATKRDTLASPRARTGRDARIEFSLPGPLLEYTSSSGGPLKWCGLYFGGESTAGH